jgi:hypothetical protein
MNPYLEKSYFIGKFLTNCQDIVRRLQDRLFVMNGQGRRLRKETL